MKLLSLAGDLLHLFYPLVCPGCGSMLTGGESFLCMSCLSRLPRTQYHSWPDNPVASLFWGRVQFDWATSWCLFQKESLFRALIHKLKYSDHPALGVALGQAFALDLAGSPFQDCHCLVPVPLHKRKLQTRGYNQSERIATGMGLVLQMPVADGLLVRRAGTQTQTHRHRFERWENVEKSFALVNASGFEHKHLLLVDDVVTTGATLEACARLLLTIPGVRVSIAVLGVA